MIQKYILIFHMNIIYMRAGEEAWEGVGFRIEGTHV